MILIAIALAAAPQTQADMNRQAGTDYRAADAAMNVQYRATLARMRGMDALNAPDARTGPGYQAALLASQRAWLQFRDAECVVEGYAARGGSAEGMVRGQCLARLTQTRTAQLRQMAAPR